MRARARTWLLVLACTIAAAALAACGSGESSDGGESGDSGVREVTIYSSLPQQGASKDTIKSVENSIRLAFDEAGNRAGGVRIRYVALDDSTAQAGGWDPQKTASNARQVIQDDSTLVYLAEYNSGAAAVSIPITNQAGLTQLSATNSYVGLTTDEPGSEPGEPDKYYPTGERTYARIVPKDTIQGAALSTLMKEDGCTKVQVLNDKEVYGAGLSRNIENSAKEQGLEITSNEAIDKNAANYRSLASKAKGAGADCMVYSGITANNAVQIYKDFAAALPDAKLYGPDGVAESGFSDPKEGGIPADVASRVKVSVATLSPDEYPEEGQQFFADFEKKYGDKTPDPYAIYGYEAMRLALDAIERSGSGKKEDVLKAIFETKDRQSVLGTYSIDENGDTSLTDYGIYSIDGGELKFDKTIKAAAN